MKQVFNGYLHGAERVLLAPAPAEFHLELNFGVGQQPTLYLPTDNRRQYPVKLVVTRQHLQLQAHQSQRWSVPELVAPCLVIDCTTVGFSWQLGEQTDIVKLVRLPEQRLVILASKRPLDYQVIITSN
ncbi:hypothetical protein [Loigolactobacillus jiayinensis]|uniref:Uncharacterized protein n=1 Tax=Loigolactobacillus jiayinensis TaxID=2486016 RepID=A0ABW1RHN2_9LACO|nr:hypothetical protein [Loigolactobacillus jiayinensis]